MWAKERKLTLQRGIKNSNNLNKRYAPPNVTYCLIDVVVDADADDDDDDDTFCFTV